jgi:hypothetical protein
MFTFFEVGTVPQRARRARTCSRTQTRAAQALVITRVLPKRLDQTSVLFKARPLTPSLSFVCLSARAREPVCVPACLRAFSRLQSPPSSPAPAPQPSPLPAPRAADRARPLAWSAAGRGGGVCGAADGADGAAAGAGNARAVPGGAGRAYTLA